MPRSTPNPKTNPAIELLLAYDDADLMAAIHYQALRTQQYPVCLCQSGARNAFKRQYRKLLSYSVTVATSPAASYGDGFADEASPSAPTQPPRPPQQPHPLRFWRTVVVCFVAVAPVWWVIIKGLQLLPF